MILPIELVNYILEFSGYHKYRNGKYMIQLNKSNPIYALLTNRPKFQDYYVELPVKLTWVKNIMCYKNIQLTTLDIAFGTGVIKIYTAGLFNYENDCIECIEQHILDV
jgi:hypothetical protein